MEKVIKWYTSIECSVLSSYIGFWLCIGILLVNVIIN